MAWTEQLSSGRYRGGYRIPAGQKRYTDETFPHKAAALRAAAQLEAESRELGWRDPRAAARTWGDWCEEWQTARTLSPASARDEQSAIRNHLRPRWGDVPLVDITRQDIKAWFAELRRSGRAHATAKKLVAIFSGSLTAAVDAEILRSNPASRLKLGTPDNQIEHFLTPAEQERLLAEHADNAFDYALTALLIDTGLRWGEATALTANEIDFERRTVRVRRAWSEGVLQNYPKSKRRRSVPLTRRAGDALSKVMPDTTTRFIFSLDGSTQLDGRSWGSHHARAVRDAGLPHTRIHDLRHTYASTLLQAGIPLAEVGKLMGHLSVITTNRYAHLAETPSAAVLAALGDPAAIPDPEANAETKSGANLGQDATVEDCKPRSGDGAEIIQFPFKRQISG